jgi:phosphoglycerate dehydrogenase-like enzyme
MMPIFRVGISPDFYVEAKGHFEAALEQKLAHQPGIEYVPMPPQPGNIATPEALNRFDAIFSLAMKMTADSLLGVDRLALVARWGVGYDMLDVPAMTAAGVALAITPNAVKRPVAEAILTLVFALSKNLPTLDRTVRAGKWRGDLPRLGVGVVGKIAQQLFRLAASLGFARFIAYDPYVTAAAGIDLVSLEEVLRQSDYITVNTLLNDSTRGMIGEPQFRMMKPTAYFINTARGPIVNQRALTQALQQKIIAGAGIDVFEKEPADPDDPLLALDNVIVSPHALAWTEEIARDNTLEACDNILSVSRGEPPAGLVNREVLTHPKWKLRTATVRERPA